MNKKIYIPLLFLLVTLVAVGFFSYTHQDKHAYHVEVVKVEPSGYGYKILQGKKMVVYQPFVPALGKKQPFVSEEDADKVGKLVRDRIETGKDFSISIEDIRQLGLSSYRQ